jgi:hypothetical protein
MVVQTGCRTADKKFFLYAGRTKPRRRIRSIVSSSETEESNQTVSSSSESEQEAEETQHLSSKDFLKTFKIPKRNQSEPWTLEQVENFKKNWPYLRNFDYSVLKFAMLKELTGMAKQKVSGQKLLSQAMVATFDQLQSFPAQVEAGPETALAWFMWLDF